MQPKKWTKESYAQQGDVILFPVEYIPAGLKKKKDNHLAEGETTGHYHEAIGDGVCVLEGENGLYLDVPEGGTITHQEHRHIEIPAGKFRVGRVLEYDHFLEEARQVQD